MTQKINIPKYILKDLYSKQKLSSYEIARKLDCDPSVVQKRLKEYKIKIRYPKNKINISKKKLKNLYWNKNLSSYKIAESLKIGRTTVYNKLIENSIRTRPQKIINISKMKLKRLYLNEKLPLSKIAKLYGCTPPVILDSMKEYNINRRNKFESNTIYSKKSFNRNYVEKAYMIGFRLGDLHVRRDTKYSHIIKVGSNTTKLDQFNLIKEIYGKYGHFWFKKYGEVYSIYIHLDKSFKFLLQKEDKIPSWILRNNKYFFAFLGGYTDAEGSISISQNKARFRIRTYDKNLLLQIHNKLNFLGIDTKFGLACKKGIYLGVKHNKNCWGIFINSKNSLIRLFKFLKSYIKHKKRYNDLLIAEKNLLERNKKHKIRLNLMKTKKTTTKFKKGYYVTTPIYYPTAKPHLGSAYTTIAADIIVRWHKLKGEEVFFLTGTDEHTKKVIKSAEKEGKSPKEFTDAITPEFKRVWERLNIKYDRFIRTSDPDHKKFVQFILQKVYDKGDIYKGIYEGLYCTDCEAYYTEKDAPDLNCPIHKRPLENMKEETYFFKLSKYQKQLLNLYEKNKKFISPNYRKNEIINRVKEELKDLSISRKNQSWGIQLPFDKEHVAYVWFDALTNYLSGIGILENPELFKKFWPANVHLVGKDILWFHSVIWPAMLFSANLGIEQPKEIFAHGWLTVKGNKIGKSAGNAADIDYLINSIGVDSLRYFLFRHFPFGNDGGYEEQDLINRNNNELANKLGNLISRVTALAEKHGIEKTKNNLLAELKLEEIERYFDNFELDKALSEIFAFIDSCNEYIQKKKPWETKNKKVLYELADSIKAIAILLWPFIPLTSEKIASQVGFKIDYKEIKKPLKIRPIKKSEILFKKM